MLLTAILKLVVLYIILMEVILMDIKFYGLLRELQMMMEHFHTQEASLIKTGLRIK